jgi:endonuclease/exonuclease/phosphatase family metal-dependent hydrolase
VIASHPSSDSHGPRQATAIGLSGALWFISALCWVAVELPTAAAAEPEPLTVMTWNLEWFYDDDSGDNYSKLAQQKAAPGRRQWDWRRDAVAQRIAIARPTVVAFQEVENRRVLWYLSRAIDREHSMSYRELSLQSRDHFTEQDVGVLFRGPADALLTSQFSLLDRMRADNRFSDVTKHLLAVFEFPVGDRLERVAVLNVHLRSGVQGEPIRRRQARLIHHWISEAISRGDNLIVLGDFNTEQRNDVTRDESDLGILSGRETQPTSDDLIDLNLRLPPGDRQTHLLPGRQFDRIFCTPSLVTDDPQRPDLVFRSIEVRSDLAIQGKPDDSQRHWEHYWEIPDGQRDLSDHYPVIATFEVR